MKKGLPSLILCLCSLTYHLQAQQSVSIGTTSTNPSAVLWLNAPNKDQALIIPVVNGTAAVPNPVAGMVVYDQQTNAMYYRSAATWEKLGGAVTLTAGAGINISGSTITNTGDTNASDDITTATPAAGDLSGTYPNPTVARIRGVNISATTPTMNQILKFNGTNWAPADITGTGTVTSVGLTLPSLFTVTGSPVTTSGTLTATLASQTAATVFAAPAGAAGVPVFRALVATDIPNFDAAKITSGSLPVARGGTGVGTAPTNGQLLIGNGAGYSLAALTAGAGINITNGAGTVSIASTGLVSPLTTQGDIIFGGASGVASRLAGSAGFLKSTGAFAPTWSAVNLASADVSGILPVTNGGTGAATAAGARTNLGLGTLSTLNAVSTTEITDGTITNADINAAAAIAGSKIVANFGALTAASITSAGAITLGSLAGTGNRMVTADATGVLSTQAIPATFNTLNTVPKGDGTTGLIASNIVDDGSTVSVTGAFAANSGGSATVASFESTGSTLIRVSEGGTYKGFFQLFGNDFLMGSVNPGTDVQLYNGGAQLNATTTGVDINNFTRLGSTAPQIKMAYYTGTTASTQGASTSITLTGITGAQILSIDVMVEWTPGGWLSQGYYNTGYKFYWYTSGATLLVINDATASSGILSKNVRVRVTYMP